MRCQLSGHLSSHTCGQHARSVQKPANKPVHAVAKAQQPAAPHSSQSMAAASQCDYSQSAAIKAQTLVNSLHDNMADSQGHCLVYAVMLLGEDDKLCAQIIELRNQMDVDCLIDCNGGSGLIDVSNPDKIALQDIEDLPPSSQHIFAPCSCMYQQKSHASVKEILFT